MKKVFLIISLILVLIATGCSKNKKIPLEEIYGKYTYAECLYSNNLSNVSIKDDNLKYQNITRFSLKEKTYQYYATKQTDPTIEVLNVEYKEVELAEEVINDEIKELIENVTTQFDIYKNQTFQGYSFLFGKDEAFYMETRKIGDRRVVWKLVKLEKQVQ